MFEALAEILKEEANEGHRPLPLDPDADERSLLSAEVVSAVDGFLDGLNQSPANYGHTDPQLIDSLLQPPPEQGSTDIGELLDTVLTAARTGFDTAAGSQLSYIPNGGLYSGALGRFMAAALNRWTGAAFAQPGAVALEQSVIDWMIDLFGLGPSAAGLLLSGGSTATLEAVVTARSRLGERFDDAVIYTSEQAHHSIAKAARLAGIPAGGLRTIQTDTKQRMDTTALEATLVADLAAGLRPMMIAATAGTTDTGSIDPLVACADIAATYDVWFHVDAAYGGFFALTDRGKVLLEGIERADSITVDAHKSLMIPFGVGGLLVADGAALVEAHDGRGPYMQDGAVQGTVHGTTNGASHGAGHGTVPDYCALGLELSRPYRGLDVWLPLHLHGVAAFRDELDRMLDLARRAADRLSKIHGIELVSDPVLSIVAFRCVAGDAVTRSVLDRLNRSGEVHVSSTTINGRLAVRLAFLNQRTSGEIADRAVDLVAEAVGRRRTRGIRSFASGATAAAAA